MANKKFSQFNNEADINNFDGVVGYAGANNLRISGADLNQSLDINSLAGTAAIATGGTGTSVAGVANVGGLLDEASQVIDDVLVIQDDGAGNSVLAVGGAVNITPKKCQITISGVAGITNTNNSTDFRVPYNNTVFNDADTFTPVLSGASQGSVTVLKAGTYLLNARYSSFDLVQPGLPNVNGQIFMRITATVNGVKSCVLQNLIIATSGNGEATINGSQIMNVAANDVIEITAFHTGATGGSGSQGFPVNNNTFFNEPTLTLVKIG
ncbi:hypothetical protein [Phenylobacterium sp.]|uniref:hypothetical protein n=1 Tax=Phenylobacterium sp. TaxID=1871053 RepID=UPI0025E50571|nr:hypothetical protein [Phenylobacterium sp.]